MAGENGGSDAMTQAFFAWVQQQAASGGTASQEPSPFYRRTVTSPWQGPRNRFTSQEMSGTTYRSKQGVRVPWADHDNEFMSNWQGNAKWRKTLVTRALRSGLPNMYVNQDGTTSARTYDFYKVWQEAGKLSSQWADQGVNMTPMQVLEFLAGGKGGGAGGSGGSSGGSGGGAPTSYTTTQTSYNISDPATAKALTNAVLEAALGRRATPEETKAYRAALNAAERANPTVTTTHVNGRSSTSTTKGGLDSAGAQQTLLDKAENTAEGQAYLTDNVFNQALQYLSGL